MDARWECHLYRETYSFIPDKAVLWILTVAIFREEDGKREIIATTEKLIDLKLPKIKKTMPPRNRKNRSC